MPNRNGDPAPLRQTEVYATRCEACARRACGGRSAGKPGPLPRLLGLAPARARYLDRWAWGRARVRRPCSASSSRCRLRGTTRALRSLRSRAERDAKAGRERAPEPKSGAGIADAAACCECKASSSIQPPALFRRLRCLRAFSSVCALRRRALEMFGLCAISVISSRDRSSNSVCRWRPWPFPTHS